MPKQTNVNGIKGVGASSLSETTLKKSGGQGTFYGGLQVTEDIKNQLMGQEIGTFLQVKKAEGTTNEYLLQPKLPEKGKTEDGTEYSIRKNWNRIMKAIGKEFVDEKGNVDIGKALKCMDDIHTLRSNWRTASDNLAPDMAKFLDDDQKENYLNDISNSKKGFKDLIQYDTLDEKDRKDFDTFMDNENFRTTLFLMENNFNMILKRLHHMQTSLREKDIEPEKMKLLLDSAKDFDQTVEHYRNMAQMDIEKEETIYIPLDCQGFKHLCYGYYEDAMRAEENNKQKTGEVIPVELQFSSEKEIEGTMVDGHFTQHHSMGFHVKINGQDKFMTLEHTAPPETKLLFHPEKGIGGIGLYDSFDEYKKVYEDDNYVKLPGNKNMVESMQKEVENNQAVKIPSEFSALESLKKNWFYGKLDSSKYRAVKNSVKTILDLKEKMKENPGSVKKEELLDAYKKLAENSKEYLDNRNPNTPKGKERYQMINDIFHQTEVKVKCLETEMALERPEENQQQSDLNQQASENVQRKNPETEDLGMEK